MHIKDKIYLEREGLEKEGPITIVAFGDSVTHGAFKNGEIDYEAVYWNILKKKISNVRNYIPVNVINAGIGGTSASASVQRIEKQVLAHNPDLIIVCFGLNVNGDLDEYLSALRSIFEKCSMSEADIIFMTPNMLNTYVADDTAQVHMEYAAVTAEYQNGGRMDLFMSSAVKLAEEVGITVCDCYSEWKKLSETQDVTQLLINRINHPTKEMHHLFADKLFEVIFEGASNNEIKETSTMYNGQ